MTKSLKVKKFYKQLYFIREVEKKISSEYSKNEMRCPVHLSIGQEAISVGVCSSLKKNDKIICGHRPHANYLAKGGNLKSMIAEIYGKKTGCAKGLGGSMHLQDRKAGIEMSVPIVASQIPIGTGIAFYSASKLCKNKFILVIFFGEAATEEGAFHESINFASLHNLPVLFVCEDNLYSVYTHVRDRQHKDRSLVKIAKAHGIKSFTEDGNDVEKVFNVSKKSVNYIRKNSRPVLIDFKTYRWLEHCGPNRDDHLNYREKSEVKQWLKKCPIENLKKKHKKIINNRFVKITTEEVSKKINSAFNFARKSPFPNKKELKKYYF